MTEPNEYIIVLVTAGSAEEAHTIAHTLVKERLAACCNIVDSVRSVYSWENKICNDKECLMIIKSVRSVFQELENRVKELHSYQVPEIIAVSVVKGSQNYLEWLDQNVKQSIE